MKLSITDVYPAKDTIHKSLNVAIQYTYEIGQEIIISLSGILKDENGMIIAELNENYQTRDTTSQILTASEINSEDTLLEREFSTELTTKLDDVAVNHIAKNLLRNKDKGLKLEIDVSCQYLSADILLFNYRKSVFRTPSYVGRMDSQIADLRVFHEHVLLKESEVDPSPFAFIKYSTEEIANWPFIMDPNKWGHFLLGQDTINTY